MGLAACSKVTPPDPIYTHRIKLTEPHRDTLITVLNDKIVSAKVSLNFQGSISGLALVHFSSDSTFQTKSIYALSPESINAISPFYLGNFNERKLFVKYAPQSDSMKGNVEIKIVFD